MRVHTYVIATDAGSAPNYDPPAVTLAVCKPRIRKKAKVGDLVLAFAGSTVNPLSGHSVVWAGIVSEVRNRIALDRPIALPLTTVCIRLDQSRRRGDRQKTANSCPSGYPGSS
ncbi:hypothetical protein [Pseudomonas knackmussii]|uniref:Nmad2 family putative nucleotide modification protein n=1 Tax=Pseudomonas knackmussii TaxID=65741 RepID=UPI003BB7E7D0